MKVESYTTKMELKDEMAGHPSPEMLQLHRHRRGGGQGKVRSEAKREHKFLGSDYRELSLESEYL